MKLLHISDTHSYHDLLSIPKDIDMIIHSGDCSNHRTPGINEHEVMDFINWYNLVDAKYKIYVAGNHDTSIEAGLITKKDFENAGIIYLQQESVEIERLKIFGSPYTPSFLNWAFNKDRSKLHDVWQMIPEDTDILITHGPPMNVLDLAYKGSSVLEFCGCSALRKRVLNIEPRLHLFGHIHNNDDIINAGYTKLSSYKTTFSNGSVVTDGKFGKLTSQGNIFEL
jgi:Icc-related predicted phosphoesterase